MQVGELALGRLAPFVNFPQLGPQLLEGDMPLGRHVLQAGSLAVQGGQPAQPYQRLGLRVASPRSALGLYHLV
ncbi:MAG: hypothetical protein H0U91_14575 [Rubrobacter sp.]|nr:hypothetical protein [Rubrobacter sp.]